LNGGVICACLALLKPFFQHYMPWILELSSKSGSRSGSRSFKILGKRKDDRGYELHDIAADAVKQSDDDELGRIAVSQTYSVKGSQTGKAKSGSTDDLFAPNAKAWSSAH